jgi:hypothetical protein
MNVIKFYKKIGLLEYDLFDKKVAKFTYYDLLEFALEYHKQKLNK